MKLNRSDDAEFDLKAIYFYIADTNSERIAKKYMSELKQTMSLLKANPKLGRSCPSHGEGIRSIVCQRHVIYYSVEENAITVLRVLHGARWISDEI